MKTFTLLLLILLPFSKTHAQGTLVETIVIEEKALKAKLVVPATVEPLVQGRLTAEIAGTVTRVNRRLGETVKRGEAVFFIKSLEVGIEFREYAVRSLVDGEVTELNIQVGSYVSPGQIMGHVTNSDSLLIKAEVPASHTARLRRGLKALFNIEGLELAAEIRGVARHIKENTGTASVELMPVEKSPSIISGTVGRLTIFLDEVVAKAIPIAAKFEIADKEYVRTIDANDKVVFKEVVLGEMIGQERVVNQGLEVGDEVIIRSADHLREGDPIRRQTL